VYSSCTLIGHVGADPISRALPNGKTVVSFSIAVDEGKDANGQDRPPIWWKCSAWDDTGTRAASFLRKGTLVFVAGTPTPVWADKDKDGNPRGQYQCRVRDFRSLSPKTTDVRAPAASADTEESIPF
jgi:single-stranded DNA-binding protein